MGVAPAQQGSWDWRATGNFAGGGTGSGLLLMAALVHSQGAAAAALALLGTALIAAGLGLVWLEIGRPWRFLNVYRNPFTSWMSREAWLATALLPLALAAVAWRSDALALAAALLALAFLYSQARILGASRGIPAWRLPQIVPLIITTGIAEGAGILLAAWALVASLRAGPAAAELVFIGGGAGVFRLWAWSAYRDALLRSAPEAARAAIARAHRPLVLYGHVLPVLLLMLAVPVPALSPICLLAAGLALWGSGWALKFVLVNRAAFNQGFALTHSPARGAGTPGPGARPGWGGD